MAEVLSQEEIDQLLTAINAGNTEPEDFRPVRGNRKIKIYDFKRPDKFSKEQIRTVAIMHENLARSVTSIFSEYFRKMVHAHVASVDQLTYEEFIRSVPTPTTLAVINMMPLPGNAVVEIDPVITNSMINRLFGGEGRHNCKLHELTDLEKLSLEEILHKLITTFKNAWENVIRLRAEMSKVETNPQFVQITPRCEMMILVTLEIKFGDEEGMMNICLPYLTLEPIMQRLSAAFRYSGKKQNTATIRKKIVIDNIPVLMKAELFSRVSAVDEILKWKKMTVIYPHRKMKLNTCRIKIGDQIVFGAEIIENYNYNRQIRIEQVLKPYKECFMENNTMLTGEFDTSGLASALKNVNIEVSVELGRTRRMIKEILSMGEGTIVELDKLAGEPVDILANNVPIARGEVVVIDENFGVRVTELLNTERTKEDQREE
jgi:flagellar motor switch protein FliM